MGYTATQPLGYPRAQRVPVGSFDFDSARSRGASNVQGLGFTVLLCFLFMIISRVFDMYFSRFHIPGISERLMALVVVMSGSFWRPFRTSIGKKLAWLTVWMVLGIPFSVWKGDSFKMITTQWLASMVVFTAAAGLILNFQQYRRAVTILALAFFALSLFCLHFGSMETGRLFMANRSRFANPNEMAQAMLIGIPFWLAIGKRSASPIGKLAAGIVLLLMGYIIAKTGSRGALISFAVLYLVLLHHASAMGKAGLLLVGSLSMCVALAFLPSALKDRYKTIFSEDAPEVVEVGEEHMLVSAMSSTESREHLLRQSLILTATHPIFGVGVGQFPVAENALAISQGKRKGSWLGTHNTYMQLASETGLPGVFLFILAFFLCLKTTHSLYTATKPHRELKEVCLQAEALFLSLLCLAITDMSIHVAYTMLLPVLAGMTVSLEYTSRPMIAALRQRSSAPILPGATVRQADPVRAPATGLLTGAS
jgi:O-antigen ligase